MTQGLRKLASLAAVVFTMTVAAPEAQAATCTAGSTFGPGDADVTTSTACLGEIAGNDVGGGSNWLADNSAFGISDWTLDSKWDLDEDTGIWAESPIGLLEEPTSPGAAKSGDWSVSGWGGVGHAAIAIKGGPDFAVYLIDISAGLSGEWSTRALTNPGGRQPAISHISLYTAPAAIPLPAGGVLLLTALGGLGGAGALRRKRRQG